MENTILKVEDLQKEYRLGQIGGTTLRDELQRQFAKLQRKDDPTRRIGTQAVGKNERFLALKGISLEVKKGERVGIIGHNGAGKSTLLKLISRVTAPSKGTIYLNGRIASMLEVGTGFHGELTGRENIYMNGAILGMTRAEIDKKIEDIIEFSEVRQFIDTPVKRYSSGMYVKLAFSVAAHLDSEIMIMDEVLAVGDMAFQKKCLNKMKDVSCQSGRTILYVSHNMDTIRRLCDRCIVMEKGRIVYDGDVEEAIAIYMAHYVSETGTEIDLSKLRMQHLPKEPECKMMHLSLLNKEAPSYDYNEPVEFSLKVKSFKPIQNLSVRAEIRAANDTAVGVLANQNLGLLNGEKVYHLVMTDLHLVAGKYKVLLVIYEIDENGNYDDLDAINPAFSFSVTDEHNKVSIRWNNRDWGHLYMGDLEEVAN